MTCGTHESDDKRGWVIGGLQKHLPSYLSQYYWGSPITVYWQSGSEGLLERTFCSKMDYVSCEDWGSGPCIFHRASVSFAEDDFISDYYFFKKTPGQTHTLVPMNTHAKSYLYECLRDTGSYILRLTSHHKHLVVDGYVILPLKE